MKNSIKTSAIAACIIFAGFSANAQSTQPAGAIPPPPPSAEGPGSMPPPPALRPGRPGAPDGVPRGMRGLQQLSTLSGKVTAYVANDRYEYDALTLQTSGSTLTVRFPSRLGSRLMKSAPKGESITLNGFYDNSPQGINEFHMVNVQIGTNIITDTPPVVPVTPPADVQKTFTGTISDLRRNQEGRVNGIFLSGKEIVELPPPAAEQLQTLLKTGDKISGNGIKVTPPEGVVMAQNVEAIHPQTLTINGQTYLVR